MIAIKTADLTQDFRRIAECVIQGETVLVSRPKNENLVIITEKEYNELDKSRKKSLSEVLRNMQEKSAINGTSEMSLDEINNIISEVRQEKRVGR